MTTFAQLAAWIEAGEVGRVASGLLALGEPERRALAGPVKEIELEFPHEWPEPEPLPGEDPMDYYPRQQRAWEQRESFRRRREGALRVAGAGCLPRAADVVTWLRSDRFWLDPLPASIDAVVAVLRAPGRPSIEAVAKSLADKLRPAQVERQWPIVARLLDETGLPTPATEATVRGWMGSFRPGGLTRQLRDSPRTGQLLPHVFTIPRVGALLGQEWPPALARLCADGDYDRTALLEGCLLRLRAGDRPSAVKPVVELHRLLDPAPAELAAHRQEYLGMLSSPHVAVAELALRALRTVDETGQLDVDAIAEAAFAVLPRPEKKLVRAQLDWLGAALARAPDPRLFDGLAAGLANEAVDLAERALKLAAKHLPAVGPQGRATFADAAAGLEGDLRRQAEAVLHRSAGDLGGPGGQAGPPHRRAAAAPGDDASGLVTDPAGPAGDAHRQAAGVPGGLVGDQAAVGFGGGAAELAGDAHRQAAGVPGGLVGDQAAVGFGGGAAELAGEAHRQAAEVPAGLVGDQATVGFGSGAAENPHRHAAGAPGGSVDDPAAAGLGSEVGGAGGDPRRPAEAVPGRVGTVPLPAVAPAAPMPAAVTSIAELTGIVVTMLHKTPDDPVLIERLLAGLLRFAHSDRAALAEALRPVIPEFWDSPLVSLLWAAAGEDRASWEPELEPGQVRPAPPFWMIVGRMAELTHQLRGTLPPALLATPATMDGHVDPARVLALLAEGCEPGPWDLSQALLRLPRDVDPAVREGAERLGSPAGRAFAAYLRDGLPDPEVVTVTVGRKLCGGCHDGHFCYCLLAPVARRTVAFEPVEHESLTVPAGLLGLPADQAQDRAFGFRHAESPMAAWPMMLPSHREIVAAHAQPLLTAVADGTNRGEVEILPVLARTDGPFGPAMALCLAYGLTAGRPGYRITATDAFVLLAARGLLDGGLVGRELAELYSANILVLKRVAESLVEAVRAGAAEQVWALARELVPVVLAAATPGSGAPDLLALAESAASGIGAAEELPGVAEVAARRGKSRLVTEAARLARTIAGNQGSQPA
ncbi:DUF6493 family protein [Actinoplanes sp. NPDC024001]|uniref:DUF6493 family protein n=1 Tax=Actinoplanes sp. NPDC024001 TaxID=3154598 RepID=UPI003408F071